MVLLTFCRHWRPCSVAASSVSMKQAVFRSLQISLYLYQTDKSWKIVKIPFQQFHHQGIWRSSIIIEHVLAYPLSSLPNELNVKKKRVDQAFVVCLITDSLVLSCHINLYQIKTCVILRYACNEYWLKLFWPQNDKTLNLDTIKSTVLPRMFNHITYLVCTEITGEVTLDDFWTSSEWLPPKNTVLMSRSYLSGTWYRSCFYISSWMI